MSQNPNIEWAETEIAKHQAAIEDLRVYIRVEQAKPRAPEPVARGLINSAPPSQSGSLLQQIRERGAKKRAILTALVDNPQGLKTPQIVAALGAAGFQADVSNTSPQLSAYGTADDPLVRHDGGIWTITQHGRAYLSAQKN